MIVDEIQSWNITDITIVDDNFSAEEFGELARKPNRFTLYFHGEVPLTVYDSVLYFDDQVSVPELSFNRIVVDWNPETVVMDIYFISKTNKTLYSAKARAEDYRESQRSILEMGRELAVYGEVNPGGFPYIVVPVEPLEVDKHTYLQEENNPSEFRDALFSDPNAVRRSHVSSYQEEYVDDHARMKVFTDKKKLDFVYPANEDNELAIPSELLEKTIYYVNEHGGWTDEFRYTYMDPRTRTVRYRLFLDGLPVYADSSLSTEIVQKWGKNGIFRYTRPYYTLGGSA